MSAFVLALVLLGLLFEAAFAAMMISNQRRRSREQSEKFIRELDDRRGIERELAHMASFSEMAPAPIVETDESKKIYYVNPAALSEFPAIEQNGWSHPAFEGLDDILMLLHRERQSATSRIVKLGEKIYEQKIALLLGGPRVRLYFNDITELKRLDQLKTDFVNMVSHELRSPLTTIRATLMMVAQEMLGSVTSDQREALTLSLKGIERLGRLINDLLDVSKIEAGKLELRCEAVDVGTLLSEITQSFTPLAGQRGLSLIVRLPQNSLELIVDRDKMVQVLTNLVQNALKFTQHGSVEISTEMDVDGVTFRVRDSGPGILPDQLHRLFGKFEQLHAAPAGGEKGTGLGLSLCKGLVELHHGRIWVESHMGEGTSFLFRLPLNGPQYMFREEVDRLLKDATGSGRPLTLVRFGLEPWPLKRDGSSQRPDTVLHRLQAVVKSALGVPTVLVDRTQRAVLLAMSEISKPDAQTLTGRVCADFQGSAVGSQATQETLNVKLASYPDDGTVADQLIDRLAA